MQPFEEVSVTIMVIGVMLLAIAESLISLGQRNLLISSRGTAELL
jgi:hypothetical protein